MAAMNPYISQSGFADVCCFAATAASRASRGAQSVISTIINEGAVVGQLCDSRAASTAGIP